MQHDSTRAPRVLSFRRSIDSWRPFKPPEVSVVRKRFRLEELLASGVLLLGLKTYEGFAAAWPAKTDEQGFAEKINSIAEDGGLDDVECAGVEQLDGDPPATWRRLSEVDFVRLAKAFFSCLEEKFV